MERPQPHLLVAVFSNVMLTVLPGGYEVLMLTVPQTLLEQFVNTTVFNEHGYTLSAAQLKIFWSCIVAAQAFGAFLGTFAAVPLSHYLGRKFTLMVANNLIVIAGSVLIGLAKKCEAVECLVLGRLVQGIAAGISPVVLLLFLSEISPPHFRGMASCLQYTFFMAGGALAATLGLQEALGNEQFWPYLVAFPMVFAFMQIFLFPCFPESPKYLLLELKRKDEAMVAIRYYYGPEVHMERILAFFELEARIEEAQMSLKMAMKRSKYRTPILVGCLVNFAQIFAGFLALDSYSAFLISSIGLTESNSQYFTAIASIVYALISLPSLYLVEKYGRRPLNLVSFTIITACLFLFLSFGSVLEQKPTATWATGLFIVVFIIYASAYNMGPGPTALFLSGELAPQPVRSVALAVGIATNQGCGILTIMTFYPLHSLIGSYSFLMFAVPSLINVAALFVVLPETKPSMRFSQSLYKGYEPLEDSCADNEILPDDQMTATSSDEQVYGTFY